MRKVIGLIALLMFSGLASAASGTVQINWTNPTLTTAGGPLTGVDVLTKFQFFISTTPTTPTAPTVEINATSPLQTTYTFTANSGDTVYVRMTACNASGCSVQTPAVSAPVPFPSAAPGAPQSVTIKVTIP